MTKKLPAKGLGRTGIRAAALARADRLRTTTDWSPVRIAAEVGICIDTMREHSRANPLVRPKIKKPWSAPKVAGPLERYGRGRKKLRPMVIQEEPHETMVQQLTRQREEERKLKLKIANLYVEHGVDTIFLVERFGYSQSKIWELVQQGIALANRKAGPALANQ